MMEAYDKHGGGIKVSFVYWGFWDGVLWSTDFFLAVFTFWVFGVCIFYGEGA